MMEAFNVMNFIKCQYEVLPKHNPDSYVIRPKPLKGTLFVSFDNLGFISGQVRVKGKGGGEYPFHYLEMIDYIFGREENTIKVCSGAVNGGCFTVDINPETNAQIVDDGQTLARFQVIPSIDGDVTLLTIKIQPEKCTELIYRKQSDCLKQRQGSVKGILYSSYYWAL